MAAEADGTVSMGALLDKLVEVASTYRECRTAALGRKDVAGAKGAPKP